MKEQTLKLAAALATLSLWAALLAQPRPDRFSSV